MTTTCIHDWVLARDMPQTVKVMRLQCKLCKVYGWRFKDSSYVFVYAGKRAEEFRDALAKLRQRTEKYKEARAREPELMRDRTLTVVKMSELPTQRPRSICVVTPSLDAVSQMQQTITKGYVDHPLRRK